MLPAYRFIEPALVQQQLIVRAAFSLTRHRNRQCPRLLTPNQSILFNIQATSNIKEILRLFTVISVLLRLMLDRFDLQQHRTGSLVDVSAGL